VSLRLGIDVGGTNTDAVVLDEHGSLQASAKSPTTKDLQSGIASAIDKLVESNPTLDVHRITHAMLGTTHCTNAILERRNLNRVGLVRVGAPATLALPPFTAWPADLRAAVGDSAVIVEGGHEFDGREILPLDEAAVREAARSFRGHVDALAVVSVFSSVDFSHEQRAAAILLEELGDLPMTYSREIGALGLLERENAAILNAAVVNVVRTAARGFDAALRAHGIEARLFFSQNDGTLMTLDYATRYPILTVSSGPSNSIRGAAYLSRLKNAIVVDVGGTSTDVGVLVNGFPRESSIAVDIGGVATNFRMPDLLSIALGGGTRVHAGGDLRLGPDSVGYRIVDEARVFGGGTLTASDVAVAAGQARMGDPSRVADLDRSLVAAVTDRIREMAEDTVDRMRTSADLLPVIMVGGGSVILPSQLAGTGPVHRPDHYDVANAIGAAIAQCSGEIDRVFPLDGTTGEALMEQAQDLARQEAVNAGADPATVEIVEVHEVPLAYLPNRATRIRVRASGDLAELSA
jgi:N-methylhydantoinase A/oxoprolinase/acetone carboxylase beta subunit